MGPSVTLLGKYYVESGRGGNRNLQPDKYLNDALVLEQAFENDDGLKTRYAFYCAQSYRDAGYVDKAIEWYKKVLTYTSHWDQELYFSSLQLGNLYQKKNQGNDAVHYYMKTVEYDSERIEGVVLAMRHFHETNNHALVNALYHKYKQYSKKITNKLFADMALYQDYIEFYNSISAYYVHDKVSGYQCCKDILMHSCIRESEFNTTLHNILLFYKDALMEDKDTLQLFYRVDHVPQPWNNTVLELWNILFGLNQEKLTTVTPSMLTAMKSITQQAFVRSKQGADAVMITFTTCKRLDLFKQTINSILIHWKDLDLISQWFCVDDNSSDSDRLQMVQLYPWIHFYMKKESEKGHCNSMNIIWNKLNTVKPKYWIHMEDDFLFYHPMHYIKPFLPVLESNPHNIKQIVYNRNYAETVHNYSVQGHLPTTIPNIVLHDHHDETKSYPNCHYWPHYSFRPSICLVEPILQLGPFTPSSFFEKEYALRWTQSQYKTAFYDRITHKHIGRLTSEIGKVKNAYDLNNESQFGNHPYMKIVNLERRFDRKQNVQNQFNLYSIQPSWVNAVDGQTLSPTPELKQLFLNNDFGSRRGVIGCALSHYQLWQELLADSVHDYYVIFEDDITLCDQFKTKLDTVLTEFKSDLLFLGYHMFSHRRKEVQNVYDTVDVSTLHPFQPDLYVGGTFSYVMHKTGAQKCIDYIKTNGIRHGIDYLMKIVPSLIIQEARPFLVHSPWCEFETQTVDTDIQTNRSNLFEAYDQFDYVPKLDQMDHDIYFYRGSLQDMLIKALQNPECVAFNTLGFFKNKADTLVSSPYFKSTDGIYIKKNKKYRVKMLCNWCSSEQLCKEWSNMHDSTRNFIMTSDNDRIDYYVVINSTTEHYVPEKTVVFQMEPWVYAPSKWGVKTWGEWAIPDPSRFLSVRGRHSNCHNNVFWQIEQTYDQLLHLTYAPKLNIISTICSSKYFDEGHIARIQLLQYIEAKESKESKESKEKDIIHIYNKDNHFQFTNYNGPCTPYVDKSKGILPYKYYFMVENNYEENFITEKLWEPILCESLCFYYGCPNVANYVDPRAYVQLPMHDFEACYQLMLQAVAEDWWSQRLPYILEAKQKILKELSFSAILHNLIQ
jgi:GR25 family glycosyltransferase involved in LPS biosynthesis/tetratricopeptide (TPR) repeat protein